MAVAHITFNDQLPHGRDLRRALNLISEGRALLTDVKNKMAQMKDEGAVGAYLQGKFGCNSTGDAAALVAEVESLEFKLNTNASQTDVSAAITQAEAKLG